MKFKDIMPGKLAVINDSPDAKVYFVMGKDTPERGVQVYLGYWLLDGTIAKTSPVHYSLLLHPTEAQVQNRIDELDAWYDQHPEFDELAANAPVWAEFVAMISYNQPG